MVDKDNIKLFVTNNGTVVGELAADNGDGFITLRHPFRVIPNQDGTVSVAALFIKEEWCTFAKSNVIEISVPDGIKVMYVDYESQLWSTLVMPEKKSLIV